MVLSNRQLLVWVLFVWNREFDWNIIQDNQTTLTFRTNNHCNRRPNTKTKKKWHLPVPVRNTYIVGL